jgi:hypothetical protein
MSFGQVVERWGLGDSLTQMQQLSLLGYSAPVPILRARVRADAAGLRTKGAPRRRRQPGSGILPRVLLSVAGDQGPALREDQAEWVRIQRPQPQSRQTRDGGTMRGSPLVPQAVWSGQATDHGTLRRRSPADHRAPVCLSPRCDLQGCHRGVRSCVGRTYSRGRRDSCCPGLETGLRQPSTAARRRPLRHGIQVGRSVAVGQRADEQDRPDSWRHSLRVRSAPVRGAAATDTPTRCSRYVTSRVLSGSQFRSRVSMCRSGMWWRALLRTGGI